jgi:hypothetical protein
MPSLKRSMYNNSSGSDFLCSLLIRKDMRIKKTFGSGFSWSKAVDAAADTYNGVG